MHSSLCSLTDAHAFPSPNQWATCQPGELCKRSLNLARLPGAGMLQEDTGLFLQCFEAIILVSHFFSTGNGFKGWKIIAL